MQRNYYKQPIFYNFLLKFMDADTSIHNDSFSLEHLTKEDQPLNESQIGNKEAVRSLVKRYQNRIKEMAKIINNQKKQNDGLKVELKSLNEHLNNVIEKLNSKTLSKAPLEKSNQKQLACKELENEIKKNTNLQKEINQLRIKVKSMDSNRILELENQLRQKERRIEELSVNIKMYEKMEKKQKNSDPFKVQKELNSRISVMNEEILHLRGKISQQKKHEEMLDKMMKKQHEHILSFEKAKRSDEAEGLEAKCHKKGVNNRSFDHPVKENLKEQQYVQKIQQLQSKYENAEVTKKLTQKHLRHEIEILKSKIKSLELEVEESKTMVKRKDKEANILVAKMKQTERKNFNTLEPIERIQQFQDFGSSGLFDQRKEFRGLVHIQGNYRKFDDTENLSLEKNYRIKALTFTWHEQFILSLDTVYELKDKSRKELSTFKTKHNYQNIKIKGLELNDFEYIKEVEVYCSKFIEFIKIQSSRDQVLQVGHEKNLTKCKHFHFDIKSHEKPIAFLGAIDTKKVLGSEETRELLISFGLEIKKKEIIGKHSFHGSNSSGKHSIPKSAINSRYNDKIIHD